MIDSVQKIDNFAQDLTDEVRHSVHNASALKTKSRVDSLWRDFEDPDRMRKIAGDIKQHVVENLDTYLPKVEEKLTSNGVHVHWASDGETACRMVLDLMEKIGATKMVKTKTMVSEEIELVKYLEAHGKEAVETDLGEYIVQIDHDHPSHIVTPIIHKNRRQVARSFEREGLGDYNDDPQVITARARKFLRQKYLTADVGLTGANFISAESGRLVLVTNEGNSRFSLAATRMHIALVGIEKIIPRDRDLVLFLNLLARSATGQKLTVYTEFISGPKGPRQPEGPEEMHVIFLDNRRTEVLDSRCREILRCIRCGACLNVCPVYRQASGHGYRSVYPGPVGAVLSPLLAGKDFPEMADLPKASSLCGACNEVCPVNIPIPDLLLKLRDKAKQEHVASPGSPPMAPWAIMASQPMLWKTALTAGKALDYIPPELVPVPEFQRWNSARILPEWRGGEFRKWFRSRRRRPEDEKGACDHAH
ncbi:MAG: LutB/LldF family L-lactate oxidation iron-sulfur protein [Verrucomicrobiae bacterium]|nr:LutB/LldF family L-lactate oxidation iron-sulfur protein [Verrucomicrobiae bacterium]